MSTVATTSAQQLSFADGGARIFAWFRQRRDSDPVCFDERSGAWQVFRHADAERVLNDSAVFSSDLRGVMTEEQRQQFGFLAEGNISLMNPPQHRQLRQVVGQALAPRMVAQLEHRITEITNQLLDAVDTNRMELVDQLSNPLPVIVIAELLGIPASDHDVFRRWADSLISANYSEPPSLEQQRARQVNLDEMRDYLLDHCRQRRAAPRQDLITRLAEFEMDGEQLDDAKVIGFAGMLLLAAHITTMLLLGNVLLCLDDRPDVATDVRNDPSTLPPVIEEVLRLRPPVTATQRLVSRDAELGGVPLPAGSFLNVWIASANRDEREFVEPDTFLPLRDPNRHLTFGHGIHFCIGAPLARLETKIALEALFAHFPKFAVDQDSVELYKAVDIYGVKQLTLNLSVP